MIHSLYLGRVDYSEGLRLQSQIASLVADGRLGNVLLLLEHPPVLTLGRNARRSNILASTSLLASRGVAIHEINRGGDVTYHGPGQLVGYPIFDLRSFKRPNGGRMGPVDFVRGMEEALVRVCAGYGIAAGRVPGLTGVWCGESNPESARKIGAIGIHVAKGITTHGFAFNVTTNLDDFALIIPCGIADHAVTSLEREIELGSQLPSLEQVAHQTARQFESVFDQQVLAVGSLNDLHSTLAVPGASAPTSPQSETDRSCPAEDTPLTVPFEVDRLLGSSNKPLHA